MSIRVQPRVTRREKELAGLVDRRARAHKILQSNTLTGAEHERLQAEVIRGEDALKEFWVLNEKRIAFKIHELFIPFVEKGAGPADKQSFSEYAKTQRYQDALDVLQQLYLDLPQKVLTYDESKGELISYVYEIAKNAGYQFKRDREWEAKNVTSAESLHETLAAPTLDTLWAEHDKGSPGEAPLVPEKPDGGKETPESLAAWHELYYGQAYSPADSLGHVADPDVQRVERARRRDARRINARSLEKGRAESLDELIQKGIINADVDREKALANTPGDEQGLRIKYTWEIRDAVRQTRATLSPFEQKVYGMRLIGYRTKDIAEQLGADHELIERTLLQAYGVIVTSLTLCGFNARRFGLPGAPLSDIKQRITHRPLGDKLTTSPSDEEAEKEIERASAERINAMRTKIAALAPKLRQTIELLLEGKGYPEIAAELKLSEATVRKRVERARREMSQKEQMSV